MRVDDVMTTSKKEDVQVDVRRAIFRAVAESAVDFFDLPRSAKIDAVRLGENGMFRIRAGAKSFALRIHRRGYRTNEQIRSELEWLVWLHATGIQAPTPVAGRNGEFLQVVPEPGSGETRQCVLLEWLDGEHFDGVEPQRGLPMLGRALGQLHRRSQKYIPAVGFDRPRWDVDGLIGPSALLGDYRVAKLDPQVRQLFDAAGSRIQSTMDAFEMTPERFGLIHGDMHEGNALLVESGSALIDFDDCGWGWYLFDVATIRYRGSSLIEKQDWLDMFLSGYGEHVNIDESDLVVLPALVAARALAFVGWTESRLESGDARRQRYLHYALERCRALLDHG